MIQVAVFLLRCYQRTLAPLLPGPPRCRFYPSCSNYAIACFQADLPIFTACWKIIGRLLRCHPFHPGGVDYP